jgi:hypothetical protein
MKHPWRFFVAALAASAVIAVGFGLTVDDLLAGSQPAPQLRSVSAAALASAGLTLGPATQPPYCGAAERAASSGWVRVGAGGCAISRAAAERAAALGSRQVVESVLARVTTSDRQPPLHDRLAWLVVVRGGLVVMPAILCRGPATGTAASCGPLPARPPTYLRVMVLDGVTGQVLTAVSPGLQARQGIVVDPFAPRSLPPVRTLPTAAPAVRASPLLVPPRGD